MKKILVTSIIAFALGLSGRARAQFAGSVVDYNTGTLLNVDFNTGNPFNNQNAVLGAPGGIVGVGTGFPGVYSPFDPPFQDSSMTGIGAGGQLTLRLQNYVTVTPGSFEIGIWSNVGFIDTDYPNGTTGATAGTFGGGSAVVSVSADGINWVTLNGGSAITFGLPGNYYVNAGPQDPAAPESPELADFGKPFTGTLSDFDNKTYSQILGVLDGSAGGTWLNLDGTGLSQIGYIRFNGVGTDEELDLSTISINSSLAGTTVIPEPGTYCMLFLGGITLALGFRRRQFSQQQ